MTTIIANIPKRNGKPARTETFRKDETGRWSVDFEGSWEGVLQEDVIYDCRKATNWPAIKSQHFPMHGFHN